MIGTARNVDMLQMVPHTDVEELSMAYRVQLGKSAGSIPSVLVTNDTLKDCGTEKEQLHADGMENSEQNRPGFIRIMRSVMAEKLRMPEDVAPPMYVVSNENCVQSAATAFYPDLMEAVERALKGRLRLLKPRIDKIANGE